MKKLSIPTVVNNQLDLTIDQKEKLDKELAMFHNCHIALFQHNNLIEARYSLTLQEKRLILWLISQIKPDDQAFKKHKLVVRDFMSLMGLTGKANYEALQKITLGLMKKVIVIKDIDTNTLTQVNWVNCSKYKKNEGVVELSFSPEVAPFLLQLRERFTTIKLSDIMQFSSIYAIRIYELLKQYEPLGERIIDIMDLRLCLGITEKFKQFCELKTKVLLIAQKEINNKSDIMIGFEPIKQSRKFVAIKFTIQKHWRCKKEDWEKELELKSLDFNRKPALYDVLYEYGLSDKIIKTLIKTYTEERIQNAIKAVEIQINKGGVKNTVAMLKTAMKEGWHPDRYFVR